MKSPRHNGPASEALHCNGSGILKTMRYKVLDKEI